MNFLSSNARRVKPSFYSLAFMIRSHVSVISHFLYLLGSVTSNVCNFFFRFECNKSQVQKTEVQLFVIQLMTMKTSRNIIMEPTTPLPSWPGPKCSRDTEDQLSCLSHKCSSSSISQVWLFNRFTSLCRVMLKFVKYATLSKFCGELSNNKTVKMCKIRVPLFICC